MAKKGGLHGWVRLPDGQVLARFNDADPSSDCGSLDLLVSAPTRTDAVARAKNFGLHGVHLRTNPNPPDAIEIDQFVESGRDMLWQKWNLDDEWRTVETWPISPTETV